MFASLLINGLLYAAYFLEEPYPNRVGYWFLVYFLVLPALGLAALVALVTSRALNMPWQAGALVLVHAVGVWLLALALGLIPAFAGLLPTGVFEILHVILLLLTFVSLVIIGRSRDRL